MYINILNQIKTLLESVEDIGRVHDYLRYWENENHFESLASIKINRQNQIRAWLITRDSFTNSRFTNGGPHRITHNYVIRGYLAIKDSIETEKTFQSLVEKVAEVLDNTPQLNCNAESSGPANVSTISHRTFGQITCHYCEINFPVIEQVQRTY